MTQLQRKTKRLVVRPLAKKDYKVWLEANTTMLPQRNKWDRANREPSQLTRAVFEKVLRAQKAERARDQYYHLAIFERSSGEYVGGVSVMDVIRGPGQSAYLGYAIFNRHWGKGFGKEACLAAIDIGFRDVRVHRLEAGIEPSNRRSIALAKSLGMRREGLKKRAMFARGDWIDLAIYSLTCEEVGIKWKSVPKPRLR